MAVKVPKIRGNTIYKSKETLRRVFGAETLKSMLVNCMPKTREVLGGMVLQNEWYPEEYFADFVQNIEKEIGSETFIRYTKESAKYHLNTILRMFLKVFISPQKFAENNKKLWDELHDSGEFEVINNEKNMHTIKIADFDFMNKAYTDAFVNYHLAIIEMTGGKNVKGTCLKTGKRQYFLKFTWE